MHPYAYVGPFITLLALLTPAKADFSYFIIDYPNKGAEWANNATNHALWTLGANSDIQAFDVELARLSGDGLLLVARNVPTTASALPITLTDVPSADDYFLLFLNATHGVMHAISPRFTILPAGQSPANSTVPSRALQSKLATVSVSGSPNPTSSFAYTFAPSSHGYPRARTGAGTAGLLAAVVALWAWL